MAKSTTINIDTATAASIDARRRGGETRSNRLTADLIHYYALLDDGLRSARRALNPNEAALILDVLSAASPGQAWTADRIAARVDDAIALDALADKWGVGGSALVATLRDMDDFAVIALIDWAEGVCSKDNFDVAAEISIFRG